MRPAPRLKKGEDHAERAEKQGTHVEHEQKEQIAMTIEVLQVACEPVLRGGCTGGCCW